MCTVWAKNFRVTRDRSVWYLSAAHPCNMPSPAPLHSLSQELIQSGKLDVGDVAAPPRRSGSMMRGQVQPPVVVLVPTRELAVQVGEQAARFGEPLGIKSV
jgi:hypothetical protein